MDEIKSTTVFSEKVIKDYFGLDLVFQRSILLKVPVGPTTFATLFLDSKKQLYLFINGQSRLTLGDIKKIISKMGLVAGEFFPPKNRPNYFNEVAEIKFSQVFPGRKSVSADDLAFYRTLVPYSPALISIKEVKNSAVYQYDSDAYGNWRLATKFTYRRLKSSFGL